MCPPQKRRTEPQRKRLSSLISSLSTHQNFSLSSLPPLGRVHSLLPQALATSHACAFRSDLRSCAQPLPSLSFLLSSSFPLSFPLSSNEGKTALERDNVA